MILLAQTAFADPPVLHAPLVPGKPAVVGFAGDTHGQLDELREVLKRFHDAGVTHIVDVGDLQGRSYPIESLLELFERVGGVPPERAFLMPGNWEALGHGGVSAQTALSKMKRYGTLITEDAQSYGVIEIAGRKIMASHYPLFLLPQEAQPAPQFHDQEFLANMKREVAVPADIDLIVSGHTHVRALFQRADGVHSLNVGTLWAKYRAPGEVSSFAVYEAQSGLLKLHELGRAEPVKTVRAARPELWLCDDHLTPARPGASIPGAQ